MIGQKVEFFIGEDGDCDFKELYFISEWRTFPGELSDRVQVIAVVLIFHLNVFIVCCDEYIKLVVNSSVEEKKLGFFSKVSMLFCVVSYYNISVEKCERCAHCCSFILNPKVVSKVEDDILHCGHHEVEDEICWELCWQLFGIFFEEFLDSGNSLVGVYFGVHFN